MRKSHLTVLALFVVGTPVACGGAATGTSGTSGSGSVSGTVDGKSFTVESAVATVYTSGNGQIVEFFLTNHIQSCAELQSHVSSGTAQELANQEALTFVVTNQVGDLAAGTYTVGNPTTTLQALFYASSSTCSTELDIGSTSGNVTLTQISLTSVAGTYDLTFGTQGTFSGSFDIPICDLPEAGTPPADAGALVCQQ